ncbi:MAG TPA: hypothetical protein VNN15_05010, partial [Solirubrobacterales bacterium]|nr:hypothetical protein [Solirubrobacterales bacterium]
MLLFLALVSAFAPNAAVAAECTDTWTGPTEGSWSTASNWSAGHVPGESDVACIGSGKTAKLTAAGLNIVQGVEGAGTVYLRESTLKIEGTAETWQLGALRMAYGANLTGPGSLEVQSTLVWEDESTMSGNGKTILGAGSSSTLTSFYPILTHRTLVNNGTLTLEEQARIRASEEALLENNGTINANTTAAYGREPGIVTDTGVVPPELVNNGTIRKASASEYFHLALNVENTGTIKAENGAFRYDAPWAIVTLTPGSVLEGTNRFVGSGVVADDFLMPSGILKARESPIVVEGLNSKVSKLEVDYGTVLTGPGDLEVSDEFL